MSAFSDYVENKVIDALMRGQSFPTITNVHVALFTAAPSDSGGGTEVSGNNYGRVSVSAALSAWAGTQSAGSTAASSGTGGVTSNNSAISFPTPSGSWGTVTHWGLFDASTGGNLLVHAALTASKTINSGDTVSFASGALQVTVA